MGSFYVREVTHTGNKPGKFGEMSTYSLALVPSEGGEQVVAELYQKATTAAPVKGETLDGEVEDSQWGKKFRKAKKGFVGGGARPEDPERSRRILRQHSQHMALEYAKLRQSQGKLPDDFSLGDLRKVIEWFDQDVEAKPDRDQPTHDEPGRPSDIPSSMPHRSYDHPVVLSEPRPPIPPLKRTVPPLITVRPQHKFRHNILTQPLDLPRQMLSRMRREIPVAAVTESHSVLRVKPRGLLPPPLEVRAVESLGRGVVPPPATLTLPSIAVANPKRKEPVRDIQFHAAHRPALRLSSRPSVSMWQRRQSHHQFLGSRL